MVSGFGDVSLSPQNQYCLSFETPGDPRKKQENATSLLKKYFKKFRFFGNPFVESVRKDGHRTIPTISLIKSWTSWIWDQYLSKMKWELGNMGSLNLWDFEFLKPRHQEIVKPRNSETNKRWNQETNNLWNQESLKPRNQKPRNQNNKKPINCSSKGIPSTPPHTDSHPSTLDFLLRFHVFQYIDRVLKICKNWLDGSRSFFGVRLFHFNDVRFGFPGFWYLKIGFRKGACSLSGKKGLARQPRQPHRGFWEISCNFKVFSWSIIWQEIQISMFPLFMRVWRSSTFEKTIANNSGRVWDHPKP